MATSRSDAQRGVGDQSGTAGHSAVATRLNDSHEHEVATVGRIDVVPTILDTVCRLTGMGFAAVAQVTDERWIACSVRDDIDFGLAPGGELPLNTTICDEIRASGMPVIISDVAADPHYCDHHTPARYGFRSYISMPIVLPDGRFFGTLCAIDPEPRDLERREVRQTFTMFADLLGFYLDAAERLARSEDRLASELETSELREQFIAVIGHDLRNPLASINAGAKMLRKRSDPAEQASILDQMDSSLARMAGMIDNVLDFARGRLGGGISVERTRADLSKIFRQVVDELATTHPERRIVLTGCDQTIIMECDPQRIAQLLSNLLGNAIAHGAADQPIIVECVRHSDRLTFSVVNAGDEIPLAARAKLFHPYVRGASGAPREGLSLGLYIASQIALAHGGEIALTSSAEETRFAVTIPRASNDASKEVVG